MVEDISANLRHSADFRFGLAPFLCPRYLGNLILMLDPPPAMAETRARPTEQRTPEAPGDPAAYELAYEEATRALQAQNESLDGLRSRAGVILSAAAVVAGFLGPQALAKAGPEWIPLVAGVLLLIATIPSVFVLFPMTEWHSVTGTKKLLTDYIEGETPATMAELHRSLAWHMEEDWDSNEKKLIVRNRLLASAALALVAETILWLFAIIYPRAA